MTLKKDRLLPLLLGALAAVGAGPLAAQAQDKITLKVADIFPTTHYIVTKGTQVWMDKAVELSGGRLAFQYFPAQQLGKAPEIINLTQSGVADIGAVAPAYTPERLPMTVVGELPGMYETACAGSHALATLARPGGLLGEAEYRPQGLRVLFANMLAPYTVMTARAPLKSYKDLQGLKIYASGGAKDITLRTLNAVPIRITGPEMYQAVQRRTIDGTFLAFIGLRPYELHTLLRHALTGVNLGGTAVTYVINDAAWGRLPADIQKVLVDAADHAQKALCSHSDSTNDKEMAELEKLGATIHVIKGAEREEMIRLLAPVEAEWAGKLEQQGKPASRIAAAYRELVKGYASH